MVMALAVMPLGGNGTTYPGSNVQAYPTGLTVFNPLDFISLHLVGSPHSNRFAFQYCSAIYNSPMVFLIPLGTPPGVYELRFYHNDIYVLYATSAPFTIFAPSVPYVYVSPPYVAPGFSLEQIMGPVLYAQYKEGQAIIKCQTLSAPGVIVADATIAAGITYGNFLATSSPGTPYAYWVKMDLVKQQTYLLGILQIYNALNTLGFAMSSGVALNLMIKAPVHPNLQYNKMMDGLQHLIYLLPSTAANPASTRNSCITTAAKMRSILLKPL